MTSKPTKEASRLTSALTGISLAVGIAREATDAVPIVKQCLGAAVRIVALAERMDKDREALRSLSDKSLQLAQRVTHVMKGRVIDEKLETSLGRILKALESIETFMKKHSTRGRLRQVISYAFTVPQHVARLSGELADAVQELLVVGLLDVDHQVHATQAAVEDNARFAGEFRLLRHCEVHKLDRVLDPRDKDADSNTVVRYHSARVDGQVFVVRYCDRIGTQDPASIHGSEGPPYDRMVSYDLLLMELSTVQNSHPNVARIYGWGKGSIHDRFTVFRSGHYPTERILDQLPDPKTSAIRWAFKDAAVHLRRQGISWNPPYPPYAVDEHLEPTIGLQDDLRRIDPETDPPSEIVHQVWGAVYPLWPRFPSQEVAATDVRAAIADFHNEQLASVLGKCETSHRWRDTISKSSISHGFVLNDGTAEPLRRVLAEEVVDYNWQVEALMWADILLALDKSRSHRLQNGLRVFYFAEKNGPDWLRLHGLAEDSERIVYDVYDARISDAQRDEVRTIFGIPALSKGEDYICHIIVIGGPGTYRAPE